MGSHKLASARSGSHQTSQVLKSCLLSKMMSQIVSLFLLGSVHLSSSSPVQVTLQSKLPENPIESPDTWAWGLHPDNGLDYKARDSLSVEVCLDNPSLINTAKCKLPLDLCLSRPEFTALVGCSGHNKYPLEVCEKFPQLFSQPSCSDNLNAGACAKVSSLTLTPECKSLLSGYQPSLFECQDN